MTRKSLDEFGELLIKEVRDRVIGNMDEAVSRKLKSKWDKYIFTQIKKHRNNSKEILHFMIPIIVDLTIAHFLELIEYEVDLDLVVETSEGNKSLKEMSDGLSGEIYSDSGWIKRFSEYRTYEDEIYKGDTI